MENVLFKISYPAELHGETAVEAAPQRIDALRERVVCQEDPGFAAERIGYHDCERRMDEFLVESAPFAGTERLGATPSRVTTRSEC